MEKVNAGGREVGLGRAPSSRAPKISWNEGSRRPRCQGALTCRMR